MESTTKEEKRARADALTEAGKRAYEQGDYATARRFHEQSLVLRHELEDIKGSAASLNNLGNAALNAGDYLAARNFHEQSLALKQSIGDTRGMAGSLNNLGLTAYRQGNYDGARQMLHESIVLYRDARETLHLLNPLENIAQVFLEKGDACRAVILWGAAHALREKGNAPLPVLDKAEMEAGIEKARRLLSAQGDDAFSSAWDTGRALTLEQATEFALLPRP